ncbi:MAG: lysophospholipid acyltransferase family protein [Planctomycetes bacterium]|nr:lysophospholipid acyltransferase family protein [Planctomycetota bacterium]
MAVRRGWTRSGFDALSAAAFRAFGTGANALPPRAAYLLGDVLALAWWCLDAPRRRLALENLRIAFPDLPEGSRRRIAFRNFRHLCAVLVDTLRYRKIHAGNWERFVTIEGDGPYRETRGKGPGAVAISGHLGNWEMISAHAFRYGAAAIVAKAIHNPWIDREIRARRAGAGILQIDPDRNSPKEILRTLRSGAPVLFLVDQSAKGEEGILVPFFGRPAPTHTGPAVLALRSGAPVFPIFAWRTPEGRIRLVYGDRAELVRTGDFRRDIEENTRLFTKFVEDAVRAHPEQWFWVHDRWRIRKRRKRTGTRRRGAGSEGP